MIDFVAKTINTSAEVWEKFNMTLDVMRITGVSTILGSTYNYLTWISSSGQPYLFQGNRASRTPMYKYTLNGNIATLDTGFETGILVCGTRRITSISESMNIMMAWGIGSTNTGAHYTIDLTTGNVIHTLNDVYFPCFWFESTTRGVMIYQTSSTSSIYARIVTFNGQMPTYGKKIIIIDEGHYWGYHTAIRSGTKYFVTNASNERAMFDSADSSVVSRATAPTAMGCAFLMSPDVIRYYTTACSDPIDYYDYTISTDTFSARQMTNIPCGYCFCGHVEYNPVCDRYIMIPNGEGIVTAPDPSFTTDLQTFEMRSGWGLGYSLQDVRTCYDDDGHWYTGCRESTDTTPPTATAFTTAPSVMKKND
jgi:hypothetical protein